MAKRARSRWAKGERNKLVAPFAPFPCEMVESPAFRALSPSAVKVLFALLTVWARNGGTKHNTNGKLIVTYRQFCTFWKMSMRSVMRAVNELEALGFLVKAVQGCGGNADERQPNQYRLTFLPAEGVPGAGSHEWRRIATPEEAAVLVADKARRAAAESAPRRIRRHKPVTDSVTDKQIPACPKGVTPHAQSKAKGVTRDGSVMAFPHAQSKALSISRPLRTLNAMPAPSADAASTAAAPRGGLTGQPSAAARVSRFGVPICDGCGADLPSRRRVDARFCSRACQQRAYRSRKASLAS